ncbi:aminopeptidase P family protein [Paenibacillus donghaensis]|uniref:M24 family metallopeptidase n=1 Tax=Paenibacillus donghaensis TaxID=414771 RepID=UPI001883EB7D|nr:Xaa-Pro peptidase family protein [Paenibacillus donghaensis]MBE9916217.1 aminopeptidase P family protein [Paenibacillus donghaensis]
MLEQELNARISKLQEEMRSKGFDSYVVSSREDIWYYTNITYSPEERPFFIVISLDDKPVLVVPKLEEAHVKKGILDTNDIAYWDYPSPAGENWFELLNDVLVKFRHTGVEGNIPAEHFARIQGTGVELSNLVAKERQIKSAYEIEKIRFCAKKADETMFDIFQKASRETMVLEMSALSQKSYMELINTMQLDPANSNLLAVVWPAPESAMPHGVPNIYKKYGDGPNVAMTYYRINGYASECERTFFIGEPSASEKEMFVHMMNARNAALSILKAGVKARDIDMAARNYLESYGLLGSLLHRTGHGIGLSNHEAPFVAEGSDDLLTENTVISIEPGIYVEGVGGVRHSDTVLITKDGYELLTKAPTELEKLIF